MAIPSAQHGRYCPIGTGPQMVVEPAGVFGACGNAAVRKTASRCALLMSRQFAEQSCFILRCSISQSAASLYRGGRQLVSPIAFSWKHVY